jgi:hypothetical protein
MMLPVCYQQSTAAGCDPDHLDQRYVQYRLTAGSAANITVHYQSINQSNVFVKPFLYQQMSQSVIQKPSLKPQTASNAYVEARWLGKTP